MICIRLGNELIVFEAGKGRLKGKKKNGKENVQNKRARYLCHPKQKNSAWILMLFS
jgi:hypothetical protein